jgi:hypothetical protein
MKALQVLLTGRVPEPEPDAAALLEWLKECLSNHPRRATVILNYRCWPVRGNQYRCSNGPWCDTLAEAIAEHRAKVQDELSRPASGQRKP